MIKILKLGSSIFSQIHISRFQQDPINIYFTYNKSYIQSFEVQWMATRYLCFVHTRDFCIVQVLTRHSGRTIKKSFAVVICSVHVAFHNQKGKYLKVNTKTN